MKIRGLDASPLSASQTLRFSQRSMLARRACLACGAALPSPMHIHPIGEGRYHTLRPQRSRLAGRQYHTGHHYSEYLIDRSREVLSVERSTSKKEIKAAYFRKAKQYHPDVGG
jgi:hypothetical protein